MEIRRQLPKKEIKMKTIVEIYDTKPIENVTASLALKPDKLILLCHNKPDDKEVHNIKRFFSAVMKDLEIIFKVLSSLDSDHITKELEEIVTNNEDAAFELTGGYEPVKIWASKFCLEKNIPCFYLDYKEKNPLIQLNSMHVGEFRMPHLSIDQILLLNGCQKKHFGHVQLDMNNKGQVSDLLKIVDFALNNRPAWKNIIRYFQHVTKDKKNTLYISSKYKIKSTKNSEVFASPKIMEYLDNKELISINKKLTTPDLIHFKFKSETVKELLKSDGFWLEFYTYYMAYMLNYFDDIAMSSIIDWIPDSEDYRDPINEIDVILVKGIKPVFISCKTSVPSVFDLYEIKSLTEKFGGSIAKAALVTSSDLSYNQSFFVRARELNVALIDKSSLAPNILAYTLKSLA